jgi:hypothetical protein
MVGPEVLESEDARAGLDVAVSPMGCITASVAMVGLVGEDMFNQSGQTFEDLLIVLVLFSGVSDFKDPVQM